MAVNNLISQVAEGLDNADLHSHIISVIVFSGFPLEKEDYASDVQAIMDETLEKYGMEEWRLIALTSELHGHLGIYAIIGAKMGLYAREILSADHDELVIKSMAGSKPPVSCLNDGLQASTGATLGHGLISIASTDQPFPAADFTYQGRIIRISLKDELNLSVQDSIKEAVRTSGGLTEDYWIRIRQLGLEIWKEYNRNEIFEVTEIDN